MGPPRNRLHRRSAALALKVQRKSKKTHRLKDVAPKLQRLWACHVTGFIQDHLPWVSTSKGKTPAFSPHCCVGFLFFCCISTLLLLPPSSCTPWRRLASSGVGWAPAQISWQAQHFAACLSHTTSLTQHLSHNISHNNIPHTTSRTQHHSHNISHNNISHTTSLTQHPTHNVSHTTSLTQHLSQQHLTHNITHTTSHTQHHSHNISNTPAACQGVGCQGVGCTPWRRLASAGHRRRFRGRRSTLLLAKGSDVRPGIVWRRLASAGHRRRFRGRRSTLLLAKGSDVRPGVVWRRLGTGADFVAGAALCEPPCADFVAGTASVELEAENWRLCSTTLVRGVSAGLEDEN